MSIKRGVSYARIYWLRTACSIQFQKRQGILDQLKNYQLINSVLLSWCSQFSLIILSVVYTAFNSVKLQFKSGKKLLKNEALNLLLWNHSPETLRSDRWSLRRKHTHQNSVINLSFRKFGERSK